MTVIPCILIFLSLSIFFSGGDAQRFPWVGFYFAQQWPPGFCNTTSQTCVKSQLVDNFTIRGLLPYLSDGTVLNRCFGSAFNLGKLSGLEEELNREWPTFEPYENYQYWEYEWNTHGKCSEWLFPQREYFETALSFRRRFDLFGALLKEGIFPNDEFYTVQSITEAIRKNVNYVPELYCRRNALGEILLRDVHLCVDRLGQHFEDCTVRAKDVDSESSPCGDGSTEVKFIALSSALDNLVNEDVGITQVAFEIQRQMMGNLARKLLF